MTCGPWPGTADDGCAGYDGMDEGGGGAGFDEVDEGGGAAGEAEHYAPEGVDMVQDSHGSLGPSSSLQMSTELGRQVRVSLILTIPSAGCLQDLEFSAPLCALCRRVATTSSGCCKAPSAQQQGRSPLPAPAACRARPGQAPPTGGTGLPLLGQLRPPAGLQPAAGEGFWPQTHQAGPYGSRVTYRPPSGGRYGIFHRCLRDVLVVFEFRNIYGQGCGDSKVLRIFLSMFLGHVCVWGSRGCGPLRI